jgi:6-phosphofructokinase
LDRSGNPYCRRRSRDFIPEIPFSIQTICEFVKKRKGYGKHFTIVVVAEGVKLPPELTGAPAPWATSSAMRSNKEVRISVLGHIQRGGSPTLFDRILATRFGVAAVDLIAQGRFGKMVCLRNTLIESVEIAQVVRRLKNVDPQGELVQTARAIGISFGDQLVTSATHDS